MPMLKKSRVIDFDAIPPAHWGYLAGILDGEGCIIIRASAAIKHRRTPRYCLVVQMTNVDTRLITWCRSTFGGYVQYSPPQKNHHRPAWVWKLQHSNVEEVLKRCLPYMIVKKDQAEVGLAFCETLRMVTNMRLGVPDDVVALRKHYKDQLGLMKRKSYPPVEGVVSKHLKGGDETIQ